MKSWMLALSLVAVLGMVGLADAKNKKKGDNGGGTTGKIETIGANSFTMTPSAGHGGKKKKNAAPAAVGEAKTINFDKNTTITVDGIAGKLDASLVGKTVTVVGPANGNTIQATSISISTQTKDKKKKKKNV